MPTIPDTTSSRIAAFNYIKAGSRTVIKADIRVSLNVSPLALSFVLRKVLKMYACLYFKSFKFFLSKITRQK